MVQLISMTICSDLACSSDCVSWLATVGKCAMNSIVTMNSVSRYSDTACQRPIIGADLMPLFLDSGCMVLYAANDNKIGSYRASNTSAMIGGVIGAVIVVGGALFYCRRTRRIRPLESVDIINPIHASVHAGPSRPDQE